MGGHQRCGPSRVSIRSFLHRISISSISSKTREEVLKEACAAVEHASGIRRMSSSLPWMPHEATVGICARCVEAVIAGGATTVNIPDTVGYAIPEEFGALIAHLFEEGEEHPKRSSRASTAITISAWRLPIPWPPYTTVQGRLNARSTASASGRAMPPWKSLSWPLRRAKTCLDSIRGSKPKTSTRPPGLTQITGVRVQPNKAIVGANAFAHESGIHQDGLIKEKLTYEIMTPQSVGIPEAISF